MSQLPFMPRRWKRVEYERLIDFGVFAHDPIELIAGQLIIAEPQSAYHAAAIRAVDYTLRAVLPPEWIVSIQSPVSLDDESEPEPDLAVVPGRPSDYRHGHPAHPALVVEVAESSVAFDRAHKGSMYARARIPDYWVVDLAERVLEVYREPAPDPSAPFEWSYRSVAKLSPLAARRRHAVRPHRRSDRCGRSPALGDRVAVPAHTHLGDRAPGSQYHGTGN